MVEYACGLTVFCRSSQIAQLVEVSRVCPFVERISGVALSARQTPGRTPCQAESTKCTCIWNLGYASVSALRTGVQAGIRAGSRAPRYSR